MTVLKPPDTLKDNIDICYINRIPNNYGRIDYKHFNSLISRRDGVHHSLIHFLLQMGRLNGWYTYTYTVQITREQPLDDNYYIPVVAR